jgi:hypothetical protein
VERVRRRLSPAGSARLLRATRRSTPLVTVATLALTLSAAVSLLGHTPNRTKGGVHDGRPVRGRRPRQRGRGLRPRRRPRGIEPGWTWSTNLEPIAQTDSCQVLLPGYRVSGRMRIPTNDAGQSDGPCDAVGISPGHVPELVGDGTEHVVERQRVRGHAKRRSVQRDADAAVQRFEPRHRSRGRSPRHPVERRRRWSGLHQDVSRRLPQSRSMRIVRSSVPRVRTTSAFSRRPGCPRASALWRWRGSSSGRTCAVPVRHCARRP